MQAEDQVKMAIKRAALARGHDFQLAIICLGPVISKAQMETRSKRPNDNGDVRQKGPGGGLVCVAVLIQLESGLVILCQFRSL